MNIGSKEIFEEDLQKYTTKDYVQDGLIAMWDGIENAGYGKHTSELYWTDLISNTKLGQMTNCLWAENGLVVQQTKRPILGNISQDIYSWCSTIYNDDSTGGTLEVGFQCDSFYRPSSSASCCNLIGFGTDLYKASPMCIALDKTYGFAGGICSVWNSSTIGTLRYDNFLLTLEGKTTTVTYVQKHLSGKLYLNSMLSGSRTDISPRILESGTSMRLFPSFTAAWNTTMNGKILFIRLYARELTLGEVSRNYLIDKTRFGI